MYAAPTGATGQRGNTIPGHWGGGAHGVALEREGGRRGRALRRTQDRVPRASFTNIPHTSFADDTGACIVPASVCAVGERMQLPATSMGKSERLW
jgi:hypothetical protein